MHVIATDMDRTLLPNGKQKYDSSMKLFRKITETGKLKLVYVTGRRLKLLKSGISKYKTPLPGHAICDVGTRIYRVRKGTFLEDRGWKAEIKKTTPDWSIKKFKKALNEINGLKLQEREAQNDFKLSYYVCNFKKAPMIVDAVSHIIEALCKDATVVYSIDETTKTGLLDILPRHATKVGALEYLRKKLKLQKRQIIYCGDSGNDVLPLTFGYKSILVRNAIPEVKKTVKKSLEKKNMADCLYIAKGKGKLNGYYVSGIIEGLIEFGIVDEKYLR